MFCASLRRRASFASAVPAFMTSSLRESQLSTHDLAIPFGAIVDANSGNTVSTRHLRVLLLSPSATTQDKLGKTIKRIQHFAALTGGHDLLIVFLLKPTPATSSVSAKTLVANSNENDAQNDAIYSYSKLQVEMLNHSEMPGIPILPIYAGGDLMELLKKQVAIRSRAVSKQNLPATSFDLLQHCTANPPMPQQTAYVLSDLFSNLSELATACCGVSSAPNSSSPAAGLAATCSQVNSAYGLDLGTQSSDSTAFGKLKALRDIVGEQECRDIIDFWREEWTVD